MDIPEAAAAAPLTEDMLVMDVADTLRHGIDLPVDQGAAASNDAVLARLRAVYQERGLEPADPVLLEGLAALRDGRFAHAPPRGIGGLLARLYVHRRQWRMPVAAILIALLVGLGGYFFELRQDLPAEMDSLYKSIFDETKVQSAALDADELRNRGKEAAQKGDRAAAEQAVADLTSLRDRLQQAYTLRIVDADGVKPGFWTFPPSNSEATNYYVVVEAVGSDGKVLSLPITSEDTGLTQTVTRWGLRVPETVYDAVMADKQDDGVIEHGIVGFKQDGFVDVDYAVPVLGGAVTQW